MAAASEGYHEPLGQLSDKTKDLHRALVSLQEELEAVDWYRQRADACGDAALREILVHNLNEEIEHAAMILEWLRRRDAGFDRQLRTYLFTEEPIAEKEEREEPATKSARTESAERRRGLDPLTIGSLKQEK